MDCKTLEKLAMNPHFKMSEKQLAQLNKCRESVHNHVKHDSSVPTAPTSIYKHIPKPQEEKRA